MQPLWCPVVVPMVVHFLDATGLMQTLHATGLMKTMYGFACLAMGLIQPYHATVPSMPVCSIEKSVRSMP